MRPEPENLRYMTEQIKRMKEADAHSFDGGGGGGYDGGMETRVTRLEKFADEAQKELRSIDVRLAKMEVVLDTISRNMATKTDVADLRTALANTDGLVKRAATDADLASVRTLVSQTESNILKWFIGTVLAVAGLSAATAKLFM